MLVAKLFGTECLRSMLLAGFGARTTRKVASPGKGSWFTWDSLTVDSHPNATRPRLRRHKAPAGLFLVALQGKILQENKVLMGGSNSIIQYPDCHQGGIHRHTLYKQHPRHQRRVRQSECHWGIRVVQCQSHRETIMLFLSLHALMYT